MQSRRRMEPVVGVKVVDQLTKTQPVLSNCEHLYLGPYIKAILQ